ncbi:MAG TPA: YnbE family lipoprotein [Alphaproteobacteria bacterium]|nr:YnbE family lipoprotein [Alphaproteobacteria bacterium]
MAKTATITLFFVPALLLACQPTIKVEAPDKPIVINLNVKIEQEVRIKVEKEAEELFEEREDLF